LSFGYWGLRGAGFLPVQNYYGSFCHGLGFGVNNFASCFLFRHQKAPSRVGRSNIYHQVFCVLYLVTFSLLFISGFAGFLPGTSWVLIDKSLIINTIHFSGLYAIAGWVC
jgi:hypothetical protein